MKKFDATKYYRDKYRNNPDYRKKRIKFSCDWQKNNRPQVNEGNRERYAKRTPEKIKARKLYLKKLRGAKIPK